VWGVIASAHQSAGDENDGDWDEETLHGWCPLGWIAPSPHRGRGAGVRGLRHCRGLRPSERRERKNPLSEASPPPPPPPPPRCARPLSPGGERGEMRVTRPPSYRLTASSAHCVAPARRGRAGKRRMP